METEWSELYYRVFNTHRIYQYTSLCKESTDILDFPPHSSHITIWNENKIGNNLWKYIKIGAPFRISHGFLACNALSNTLDIISSSELNNGILPDDINNTKMTCHISMDKDNHLQIVNIKEPSIKRFDMNPIKKNLYLLFGKIDQDGGIEGLAAYRFKSLLLEGSFKNTWNGNSSFHTMLQHDKLNSNGHEIHGLMAEWTIEKPEDGNGYWTGTRLIYHFPRFDSIRFSAGGEGYYSISEKTGAVSLGAKAIIQDSYRLMTTWNPFMGHISGHYCVPFGQFLQFATRYDYNYYSYESDVSAGLTLQDPRSSDRAPSCRLGCRYAYNQGFAVQCMAKFTKHLSADLIISSSITRDIPVIGLSFHFAT